MTPNGLVNAVLISVGRRGYGNFGLDALDYPDQLRIVAAT